MRFDTYTHLTASDDYCIFEFVSIGKNGTIAKRIEFTPTEIPNFFNLAFGDIDEKGNIDDYSTSDNGDRNKVLATVAFVVEIFVKRYPDRWVYFSGSTAERTRLYRMAIGLNLEELMTKFEIYVVNNSKIVPFQKNMKISGLLVKGKNV